MRMFATRAEMTTYDVNFYELGGNPKDGFEVNNNYRHGEITLPNDASKEHILKELRKDYLQARKRFTLEGNEDGYTIIRNGGFMHGQAIGELVKQRD